VLLAALATTEVVTASVEVGIEEEFEVVVEVVVEVEVNEEVVFRVLCGLANRRRSFLLGDPNSDMGSSVSPSSLSPLSPDCPLLNPVDPGNELAKEGGFGVDTTVRNSRTGPVVAALAVLAAAAVAVAVVEGFDAAAAALSVSMHRLLPLTLASAFLFSASLSFPLLLV
jgi:hypothetical protein